MPAEDNDFDALYQPPCRINVEINLDGLSDVLKKPTGKPRDIRELRHSHHNAARFVAQGLSDEEVAYRVGWRSQQVAFLRGDPTFRELVAGYRKDWS